MKNKNTSWGGVANWYDDMLENDPDSYQQKVILPNVQRIIAPKKGMNVLDIACGQGYFSRAFAAAGAKVVACDISSELVTKAKALGAKISKAKSAEMEEEVASLGRPMEALAGEIEYHVSKSDELGYISDGSVDAAVIILAIQNIEKYSETFGEAARVLRHGGRFVLVLNHPCFRVPRRSSWGWDESSKTEYRRVDSYMSESRVEIDMTPGESDLSRKKHTVSFHRPLQVYFKALNKAGFSVERLEEWISHRKSEKGPRAAEEDRRRKEIPMFLCLECRKG